MHGDYDVDGICATALAVLFLRELGADVDWHLPSRFEEGYGVSRETLGRLADDGVGLLLTVDCGITAVDEVAEARRRGLEVIVTDHHRPGETLPDCPIVATRPSSYPFPELCGTGVVYKLGEALLGADHPAVRRNLDLVALATIADVVPLVDENRALAAAGLLALAATRRPGLQALMRSAGVDPAAVDSGAVGFRLAPRINAAGRLGRPDVALELVLTDDADEARRNADILEELNRDRQAVEDRILREATAAVDAMPEPRRRRRGYVLWNEDWHEGVIGIVASRLVERFHRPVVLITRSQDSWKGSGRSIASFDLHGALSACSANLERFGGHRAAAGLSIEESKIEAFADDFAAHADAHLDADELFEVVRVDAVASAQDLTLDLAEELARLAPFGLGNPEPTLLVPATEAVAPATVGDGKHLRFRVRQHGRDAGTRDRVRPGHADRPAPRRGPLRRRVQAQGEPLERHGRAAARGAPRLRHAGRLRGAARPSRRALEERRERVDSGGAPHLRRAGAPRGRLAPAPAPRVRVVQSPPPRPRAASRRVVGQPRPGRVGTNASRMTSARRRALRWRHQRRMLLMGGPSSRACPLFLPAERSPETRSVH